MAQISQRLQIIAVVIHILTFLFLTTAAGLFGNGYKRFNNDQIGNISVCFLFNKLKDFTSNPSGNSICVFSIVGEVLSALGLVPLIIINIAKFVRRLVGNKIIFIVQILILLFSGTFALIAAIMLSYGWRLTCDTIKNVNRHTGTSLNCNADYLKQITTSVVFAVSSVVAIAGSSVFTIIIAVLENKK